MAWRRLTSDFWRMALALLALMLAGPVSAAPRPVEPDRICTLTSATPLDAYTLLESPGRFDCSTDPQRVTGRYTYGLITGLRLVNDPADPWELRHEYSQADAQNVFVRYENGATIQAPSDRRTARRAFSPGMVSYALPPERGTIVAVLIRVENLRNQRGVAPGLEFKTGQAALNGDLPVLLMYGLLAGVVSSLLIYNFALFVSLRYAFILSYCLSAVAMLGMGFAWSGGIFLVFPDLDTTDQISLAMLGTVGVLATSVIFIKSFVEPALLPTRVWTATLIASLIGLGSCVVRLVDSQFAWVAMDRVTYLSIIAVLAGLGATSAIATARGSAAGRVYLIAWAAPVALGIARAVWALGLVGGLSITIAMSPLILMAIEALMSAFAVSWRVGQLRTERDAARALEADLRHVADTDQLTGLFNRRAFIDRALAPRARTGDRLLIIDIDQFKLVNDRSGHQAGDDVLAAVGQMIARTVPPGSLVGRIGGEEFAVLVAAEPVDMLPEHLCRAVESTETLEGLTVTISVGVADRHIVDEASFRLAYYAADQALYRSKHGGRNRVSHAPRALAA